MMYVRHLAEEGKGGGSNVTPKDMNSNKGLVEIEPSYGIVDRWKSRGQRVASSFAPGFAVANSGSDTGHSYGVIDRWRSRNQRIASSFAVADGVEKQRLKGLVVDKETRDTRLERLFDFILLPGGCCKRPRCCDKGRVARRFFVLCQLLCMAGFLWFMLFFVFGNLIQILACQDENVLAHYCPAVQSRLIAANLTGTSEVDEQIIQLHFQCDVNDNGCSNSYAKVHIGGSTTNFSKFWTNTLSEEERDDHRLRFMWYRAQTRTTYVLAVAVFIAMCGSMGAFYKTLHDNGKGNHVLFPAMLVRQQDGRMQFVRRRRYIMEISLIFGLPASVLMTVITLVFPVFFFFVFIGWTTIVGAILVGMSIQKDNVTALAISLAECTTLEQFVQWKEKLYKPTVALLHSWSQSLSNLIVALYSTILLFLVFLCYMTAVNLIQFQRQEGVLKEALRDKFLSNERMSVVAFLLGNLFQLSLLVGLSTPSMQYNGLNIVFASITLPFYGHDFELLQAKRGAFTVHGFPVTLSLAWQVFVVISTTSTTSVISFTYLSLSW
jgi:hypothetical protein